MAISSGTLPIVNRIYNGRFSDQFLIVVQHFIDDFIDEIFMSFSRESEPPIIAFHIYLCFVDYIWWCLLPLTSHFDRFTTAKK